MSRNLQSEIRQALAGENFAEAQRLWGEYMEFLLDAIRRGQATADDLRHSAQLLQFAKYSVLAMSARSVERLNEARAASAYFHNASVPELRRVRALL